MIKEAEVQNAYLLGRQTAMEKLANENYGYSSEEDGEQGGESSLGPADPSMLSRLGANQMEVLRNIGLTGQGLTAPGTTVPYYDEKGETTFREAYDPRRYATMENLARLGMLGGAAGGAMINPSLMGAGASTAGALGGGLVGGNLGQALAMGIDKYRGQEDAALARQLMAGGGALGGLAGGLGAGYMS